MGPLIFLTVFLLAGAGDAIDDSSGAEGDKESGGREIHSIELARDLELVFGPTALRHIQARDKALDRLSREIAKAHSEILPIVLKHFRSGKENLRFPATELLEARLAAHRPGAYVSDLQALYVATIEGGGPDWETAHALVMLQETLPLSPDAKVRQKVLNWALRHANPHGSGDALCGYPNWVGACRALLWLGRFRPGIRIEDVIEIVGPPSRQEGGLFVWSDGQNCRVLNPQLYVAVAAGKATRFSIRR